jgi:hypothetical protein
MAFAKRIASLKPSASIFLTAFFTLTVGASRIASQAPSFDGHPGQTAPSIGSFPAAVDREVRADMGFLASDELHGRGSATRDEHIAALFAAAQFQALGLVPGGDAGSFIQRVQLPSPLPPRVQQRLSHFEDTPRTETWNAIAILRGAASAANQPGEAILLSAHLDHLGVGPANANGDSIYNGADDDASGTAAVLALARALSEGARPRRTVVFALFGSEEIGGFGDAGFLAHPPIPLTSIVANLEFEMIGRPDPAIRATAGADALWLAGFDRSDLGPELARHGAPLVADPHPSENFFQRSDNFALARQGIIAHTVSSFGLHKDYHQPSDDLAHIDFDHLVRAIASMSAPIEWLANTTWKPAWNRGGRP